MYDIELAEILMHCNLYICNQLCPWTQSNNCVHRHNSVKKMDNAVAMIIERKYVWPVVSIF